MTENSSSPHVLPALPLFPLGTVLFPQGNLSLRIFEVRYLDMIRKCQRSGTPFGVVALQSGSEVRKAGAARETLHAEGTLAHIEQLDELQPGLLHLQCLGGQRFRMTTPALLPYGLWVADVELLESDRHIAVPEHLLDAAKALVQVLMQIQARGASSTSGAAGSKLPTPEQINDCGWVANRWAELLPLPNTVKQQLLSLENPLLRLELVADALERYGLGSDSSKNG